MYIWCWPLMLDPWPPWPPWPNFPGGRIKRRALRGIISQLAGRNGLGGFFQSSQAAVRTLGELVAKNAVDDPQLVDDPQDGSEGLGSEVCSFCSVGTAGKAAFGGQFGGSHMFLPWKDHKNRLVEEVTHMVLAIQQMMKEANGGKEGPLLDLADWKSGRYCALDVELTHIYIYYISIYTYRILHKIYTY